MRIACLDQSADARLALQILVNDSFTNCRNAVGHLASCEVFPISKEQALLNSAPSIFVIGPEYGVEASYRVCREIKSAYPEVPLVLFLDPQHFSLRTLRRFEPLTRDIFSTEEDSIRIVHTLSSLASQASEKANGDLVLVRGVKGGVGTTSIVSGLAHAAEAVGKTSIVVDLSAESVFSLYMGTQRWSSSEHAAVLIDKIAPEKLLVQRCITTAANGISVLLPPSGGTEVRELWLRDAETFEISLGIIDFLRGMYDQVIVDMANAEGVYPYALTCRANTRVLVTSNDPASVHLLANALKEEVEHPADGKLHVLINSLFEKGLSRDDVVDFLYYQQSVEVSELPYQSVSFDPRGRNWIGTGNSFYTESARGVQQTLEECVLGFSLGKEELARRNRERLSLFERILPLRRVKQKASRSKIPERKALPNYSRVQSFDVEQASEAVLRPKAPLSSAPEADILPMDEPFYESPQRQTNN